MKNSAGPNAEQSGFQGIGRDMAERLGLGREVRELKLGPTFTNDKNDFKPASVDVSKMASVDVGLNNTMTVTVPHLDGAGIPHTIFKGSHRPYSKECVLIIDRVTGEITLERLSSNIQVKKTRVEQKSQASLMANPSSNSLLNRPNTPIEYKRSPTHGRSTSRTKVTSGKKRDPTVQLHSKPPIPIQYQSSPMRLSPFHGKSPSNINSSPATQSSSMSQHTSTNLLASLPMIGSDFDDFHSTPQSSSSSSLTVAAATASSIKVNQERSSLRNNLLSTNNISSSANNSTLRENGIGMLSDSSTASSSSDTSDSESEPENDSRSISIPTANGHANGNKTSPSLLMNMPDNLLNDDLQLSESESDSD
ncbi:hypothetical protein PV325_006115 [Microctonus aethiopoides]|nr:hypothetical protein PV325_006115 [Microctonus aethiopoides]